MWWRERCVLVAEASDNPVRIGDLLDSAGARLGLGRAVETGLLWKRWGEVVGPALAAHVEPTSLKGGVLRVRADSPAWATEAAYLGTEIKTRANASRGAELVMEVRVWTSPGRASTAGASEGGGRPSRRVRTAPRDAFEALARARRAWATRRSGRS
jgi:predicted nucleic acid-binding Zn ribbon protein